MPFKDPPPTHIERKTHATKLKSAAAIQGKKTVFCCFLSSRAKKKKRRRKTDSTRTLMISKKKKMTTSIHPTVSRGAYNKRSTQKTEIQKKKRSEMKKQRRSHVKHSFDEAKQWSTGKRKRESWALVGSGPREARQQQKKKWEGGEQE